MKSDARRIRELPPEVAEKIAAGEIVERPASVLKELLENSLDAGAGQITVSLRSGGKDLIRVRDDGEGITAEDLPLAVTRYATSKLADAEDLWRISTLGFRGEALASIGRVAELTVTSKPRGEEGATITVAGGAVSEVKPAACPDGTLVEVRNLFFSVPVRRKFLKRGATEFGHASEWVIRAALQTDRIGFKLEHDGKAVWNILADASRAERIATFFGPDVSEKLLAVERSGPIFVRGVVGRPEVWRTDRRYLYTFINGRFIRDRTVGQAIIEAFRGYLIPGRFPFAVLSMDLNPERVDANVHPAKAEVRFQNSQEVFQAVFRGVRLALGALGPRIVAVPDHGKPPAPRKEEVADFFLGSGPTAGAAAIPGTGHRSKSTEPSGPSGFSARDTFMPPGRHPPSPVGTSPPPRALQVQGRYLVFETEVGLAIVDQHALHEKILYREIQRRLRQGGIAAQGLLEPVVLRLRPEEVAQVEERGELFKRLGIIAEVAGPTIAKISSVPALGMTGDPEGVFREALAAVARRDEDDAAKAVAERLACSLAIKSGQSLSPAEASALLAQADTADLATCPHGRPTRLVLTFSQLEKHFDRR